MFFKEKLIRMDVLLGILILGIGIAMIQFNPSKEQYSSIMEFTRDYIFFNLTHVFFTFVLLFNFKEMRRSLYNWARKLHQNEKLTLFLVPLFILSVLFMSGAHYTSGFIISENLKYSVILLALFAPFFHSMRQHYGLMLFYFPGRGIFLRYGHLLLLLLYFLTLVLSSHGQIRYGTLPWNFDSIRIDRFNGLSTLLMILVACGISIESLLDGGKRKLDKFLYSLRFFIYPIAIQTSLAGYLIGMFHGVEYTLFLGPIFLKHFGSKNAIRYATIFIFFTTIAGLGFSSFLRFYPIGGFAPYSIQLLSAAYFTFLYFHYLVDALLFRFSRSENIPFANLIKGQL